jgi:hypothetical protein
MSRQPAIKECIAPGPARKAWALQLAQSDSRTQGCFMRHAKSTLAFLQSRGVRSKQAAWACPLGMLDPLQASWACPTGMLDLLVLLKARCSFARHIKPPRVHWVCSRHAGSAPGTLDLLPARWICSRHAGSAPGTLDLLPARWICSRHAGSAPGTLDLL